MTPREITLAIDAALAELRRREVMSIDLFHTPSFEGTPDDSDGAPLGAPISLEGSNE